MTTRRPTTTAILAAIVATAALGAALILWPTQPPATLAPTSYQPTASTAAIANPPVPSRTRPAQPTRTRPPQTDTVPMPRPTSTRTRPPQTGTVPMPSATSTRTRPPGCEAPTNA